MDEQIVKMDEWKNGEMRQLDQQIKSIDKCYLRIIDVVNFIKDHPLNITYDIRSMIQH